MKWLPKKVTTATTKDVTAKVTATSDEDIRKSRDTKKAETVKAVAATEPKKIEKEPVKNSSSKDRASKTDYKRRNS